MFSLSTLDWHRQCISIDNIDVVPQINSDFSTKKAGLSLTTTEHKFNHVLTKCRFRAITSNCTSNSLHDDIIKWKHFPRYWPFVRGIHRSLVNSPPKGQWRGALMFSLICAWKHGWVNNCKAGDLRRYRGHYDVTVMKTQFCIHRYGICPMMTLFVNEWNWVCNIKRIDMKYFLW